jgi:hypothetical protein
MNYVLVVLKPFQGFRRGDRLDEPALVEKVMVGGNAGFFVRVSAGKE